MIKGVHTLLYTPKAEELRAFVRDKLGFPFADVGRSWLIFDLPEADLGCHPSDTPDGEPSGTHRLSFYCDDIEATVAELRARGVEFSDGMRIGRTSGVLGPGRASGKRLRSTGGGRALQRASANPS